MAAPRKYPDELRERATRLAVEARKDPAGRAGAIKRIADQLDVHPEALRGWGKRAETDEGIVPGTTSADAFWSRSYFAGFCGGAPLTVTRQYIEGQKRPA
ncbi:transposase [Streptomyces sp. NPDC059460]|uniref:transposase n=1 Tax=Streptomyces sp. NPDC059460 TaxID=3346840 RepID=UPI0036CFD7EA